MAADSTMFLFYALYFQVWPPLCDVDVTSPSAFAGRGAGRKGDSSGPPRLGDTEGDAALI